MDWKDSPEEAAWRAEIQRFIVDNFTPAPLLSELSFLGLEPNGPGTAAWNRLEPWRRALADKNWVAPGWPKEYGGPGFSIVQQFIFAEELGEAGAPSGTGNGGLDIVGPILMAHGTEQQKRDHLGAMLRAETFWAIGLSEPGAGSDLASVQTTALRDGDDFIVNGQKIWTSLAHFSDWIAVLVRTDPSAPKHKGLSYLLIDLKSPGISIRPLRNLGDGHTLNEVFFSDVRVPAHNVVGEVDRGWYVATTGLNHERIMLANAASVRRFVRQGMECFRQHASSVPPARMGALSMQWSERSIEATVLTVLGYRLVSMLVSGLLPSAESAMCKLLRSEVQQRSAATLFHSIGSWGGVVDARAPLGGFAALAEMNAIPFSIGGGTSEIQRNVIADRGLGLVRA